VREITDAASGAEIVGPTPVRHDPGAGRHAAAYPFPKARSPSGTRRLRQPHAVIDSRLSRLDIVVRNRHRWEGAHPRARTAMGTDHRATPQPLHAVNPLSAIQPRYGVLACICPCEVVRRWRSSPSARWFRGVGDGSTTCTSELLFGAGHYRVTWNCRPRPALYASGKRHLPAAPKAAGSKASRSQTAGVEAVRSLNSSVAIPADWLAEVHSRRGRRTVSSPCAPAAATPPMLKNGESSRSNGHRFPRHNHSLLAARTWDSGDPARTPTRTVIDEGYTAVGGLGPELSRLVKGTTSLAIDARKNLESLIT